MSDAPVPVNLPVAAESSLPAAEAVHGLACPKCGGMVPVPEGQAIVACPYCNLRSLVRGERGLPRFQVPQKIQREAAIKMIGKFLTSSQAIALDAQKQATLQEAFLVHLPFWGCWAHALGWVFGKKRVGSGKSSRLVPREVSFSQHVTWDGPACDVGEFGVQRINLTGKPLDAFNPDLLHDTGLVFEPIGSIHDARKNAEAEFRQRIEQAAHLSSISQSKVNLLRQRFGLVYYPVWVVRYLYRNRSFQVVVDGHTGEVLYGKAPGSVLYRAIVLVGGMAAGAFVAVDISSGLLYGASQAEGDGSGGLALMALGAVVVGAAMMGGAYRTFRYGEHYEYRQPGGASPTIQTSELLSQTGEMIEWASRLR